MRAAACVLVVLGAGGIARAHPHEDQPEHVDAQLTCMSGGRALTDGDHHPIDHDVVCEIDGDLEHMLDGNLIGAIDVARSEPFGGTANASAAIAGSGPWRGDKFGLGRELLRCADATFHATLSRGDRVLWQQTLHVRPSCPRVKLRRPAVACHERTAVEVEMSDTVGSDDEPPPEARKRMPKAHRQAVCEVTVAGAPAKVDLSASFRRTAPSIDPSAIERDALASDGDGGGLDGEVTYPFDEPLCALVRVDAVITRDGGVVWSGHTTYKPTCD